MKRNAAVRTGWLSTITEAWGALWQAFSWRSLAPFSRGRWIGWIVGLVVFLVAFWYLAPPGVLPVRSEGPAAQVQPSGLEWGLATFNAAQAELEIGGTPAPVEVMHREKIALQEHQVTFIDPTTGAYVGALILPFEPAERGAVVQLIEPVPATTEVVSETLVVMDVEGVAGLEGSYEITTPAGEAWTLGPGTLVRIDASGRSPTGELVSVELRFSLAK